MPFRGLDTVNGGGSDGDATSGWLLWSLTAAGALDAPWTVTQSLSFISVPSISTYLLNAYLQRALAWVGARQRQVPALKNSTSGKRGPQRE